MVKGLFVFGLVLGIGFPHAAGGALAPFPSTLNLDRVVQAIEAPESSIRSVEALLAWISRHHPDHLTRYTLMRRSRSSQQASPQSPRAIVFGGDAKFIFTFNGGTPGQTGHDRVEMIQFREAGRGLSSGGRFEFREIQFSPTGSRPTISEPNPARCTECHQSTLHPIWAA